MSQIRTLMKTSTIAIATAPSPMMPTSGLTSPATPDCMAPMSAAAEPARAIDQRHGHALRRKLDGGHGA